MRLNVGNFSFLHGFLDIDHSTGAIYIAGASGVYRWHPIHFILELGILGTPKDFPNYYIVCKNAHNWLYANDAPVEIPLEFRYLEEFESYPA